jgi:hypothetical protein
MTASRTSASVIGGVGRTRAVEMFASLPRGAERLVIIIPPWSVRHLGDHPFEHLGRRDDGARGAVGGVFVVGIVDEHAEVGEHAR